MNQFFHECMICKEKLLSILLITTVPHSWDTYTGVVIVCFNVIETDPAVWSTAVGTTSVADSFQTSSKHTSKFK